MSTPRHYLEEAVKAQVHIIIAPGEVAAVAIKRILAAVDVYVRQLEERGALAIKVAADEVILPGPVLARIHGIKDDLEPLKLITRKAS
jgi:hypothetical protein